MNNKQLITVLGSLEYNGERTKDVLDTVETLLYNKCVERHGVPYCNLRIIPHDIIASHPIFRDYYIDYTFESNALVHILWAFGMSTKAQAWVRITPENKKALQLSNEELTSILMKLIQRGLITVAGSEFDNCIYYKFNYHNLCSCKLKKTGFILSFDRNSKLADIMKNKTQAAQVIELESRLILKAIEIVR